ncbi:IPTL-CTERM sorting domain-containing protein [Marinobacterium sp. BA1]|uniref:IPTL-CTERM sorting domain-containing protein n=1 Tax=Marinobacterium sp. BA1 TaxID=3138931 RepID=UPI0032E781A2
MPAPEYRTLTTKSRFFRHRTLSLARWLTLLGTCTAPLLAQAQNCPTGVNTDDQYILGEADGTASAMHWATGLVWKRCIEGQAFSNSQCSSADTGRTWNRWADDYLPTPFFNQTTWGINAAYSQNLLENGGWRMAYKNELLDITENCVDSPKINQTVFPGTPPSYYWSGSPYAEKPSDAWTVHYGTSDADYFSRNLGSRIRLVRGGQPFNPLSSPAIQDVTPSNIVTFPSFQLSASLPAGQAWGGARISGDGNPEFQLNGTGGWVQEAIVKSGDQITVRFNAPDSGSRTVTFTLRSGQTTGTSDNASNAGDEATALQETSASFSVNVAPVAGVCGTADGVATLAAPSANLCSTGTASAVDGSTTAFTWICLGHGGADSGQCSAPRQYEVTPSAGANGSIAPSSVQLVTTGQTASFTVTPAANYSSAISSTCPAGSWSGSSYTTGTIMASCTVTANFAARTAMALPLAEGPHSGDTLDLAVTGSEWHIDAAQSLTATSLATALPPGVTLPHGAVSLRLTDGTPGSNATVVLTYPVDLPAGTRYYKYGPTADNPTDHWYAYPGAVISGNTITLTLTDGGAGDSDLSVNGIIDDPGGPAWITQDVAPIPTLPQWAMMLLAGIMGMLALNRVRVRNT